MVEVHEEKKGADVDIKAGLVLESSWEVCNKVGGIYTVLMSKAAQAIKHYDGNYILIGPYFKDKALGEFIDEEPPEEWKVVFEEMKNLGVVCHFGKWLIKGEPSVILLEFGGYFSNTDGIKGALWNDFQIDSLNQGSEVNDPVTWSNAVGVLIEKFVNMNNKQNVVAHFHEWLSAAGLLHLKKKETKVGTVFTTHATILGRSIASVTDLYSIWDKINPDEEAYKFHVQTKYQLEKAAAHNADVFTTVSEITGMEAEKLLGRKPDVLLPNGLDLEGFPSFEDVSIRHSQLKFRFKEFILYHFFPYQEFNLDETLLFFTFARYEFHNKGIDVFIRALAKLNESMKKEESGKTIVAFFFIPTGVKGINPLLVKNREFYEDIRESVDNYNSMLRNNVLVSLLSQKELDRNNLFSYSFLSEVKKKVLRFSKKEGNPMLCTHELIDEGNDAIMNALKGIGLMNAPEDKVKVVYYPTYLTGADGLLDLNYYEAILGGHLGVFPSIYEPWGYTPLEAGALGVSSITTDTAGFGRYVNKQRPKEVCDAETCNPTDEKGMFVGRRMEKPDDDVVAELHKIMHYYSELDKTERIDNKIEARKIAGLADWKNLFLHYIEAHNKAVKKWS